VERTAILLTQRSNRGWTENSYRGSSQRNSYIRTILSNRPVITMNTLLSLKYRRISATQIKHAAIRIQKTFRGYSSRNKAWTFGGILSQSVTLKIQRVYRGHVGRTKARALYHAYRSKKANIIQCFWRQCIARRMVRLLNAIRINRMATKIIKQWRGK